MSKEVAESTNSFSFWVLEILNLLLVITSHLFPIEIQ